MLEFLVDYSDNYEHVLLNPHGMVIVSEDVQNIRDHALVGKPSREFYVKLSEI